MIKYQSLVLLSTYNENPVLALSLALVLAHTLSRTVSTSLIFSMSYVSEDAQSKVKPLAQHLSLNGLLILLITSAVVMFFILPVLHCLVMIVCVWMIRFLLIIWFNRQLGGFTGDCLGAAQQLLEVAVYIVLLVLASPSTAFFAEIRL
jgi:adenosylcobinamide-GDP ribazoletransferase